MFNGGSAAQMKTGFKAIDKFDIEKELKILVGKSYIKFAKLSVKETVRIANQLKKKKNAMSRI
jgi:hypothetical protein